MPSYTSGAVLGLAAFGVAANAACMTDAEAQQVATNWGNLIASYSSELADAALTQNFTDYSESVNSLINGCPQGSAAMTLPLLSASFTTLDAFKMGQGQQAPINFEQLSMFHSCDSVAFRWKTTNTAPIPNPKPIIGIITAHTVPGPSGGKYPYVIDRIDSEFDAAAWLQNLNEAGICKSSTGLPTAGNATAPTTVTVVPEGCTAAPASSGTVAPVSSGTVSPVTSGTGAAVMSGLTSVAAATGTTAPYSNGTATSTAATNTGSNAPGYSASPYTGAASSLKSSFAGLAAVAVAAIAYLN